MYDIMIFNGQIFNGEFFEEKQGLLIKDGKISKLITEDEIKQYQNNTKECINAENNIIMPGMIDLQLNGCGGVLFNDEQSQKVLETMNKTNIQYGCTSFLPTLITSEDEKIEKAIHCVAEALKKNIKGVCGLHLEGPMISKIKKGIHQEKLIHKLDKNILDTIIEHKDAIKMITIAPEYADLETLKILYTEKLSLSIGHSNATYEECLIKGEYFTHATHLWNAMKGLESREPAVVGYVLDQNRLYTGIIADGLHVHPTNIRLAVKLHPETLYVTTDAVTPAGRNDIDRFIFEGKTVYVKDGACRNSDGQLGGSNVTMLDSINYLTEVVKIPLEQTLKMATSIPAKAINQDENIGCIKEDKTADIVILNAKKWEIISTIQTGKVVY